MTDRDYCDFVVWTPQQMSVQKVYRDPSFINKLINKLTTFYVEHMLPKLLTQEPTPPFLTSLTPPSANLKPSVTVQDCSPMSMQDLQSSQTIPCLDNDNTSDDDKLYCFCQERESGRMILCDNPACKFQWFHFSCVSMAQPPKGSWYCPGCQGNFL